LKAGEKRLKQTNIGGGIKVERARIGPLLLSYLIYAIADYPVGHCLFNNMRIEKRWNWGAFSMGIFFFILFTFRLNLVLY
jgi:hypothetical protein